MEKSKEDNEFNYNCELTKIEEAQDGHIYIAGIATTDSIDHDGEIVDADAVKSAWGDYKGVIRYMHGKDSRNPDAVGVVVDNYTDTAGKTWKTEFTPSGPFIVAKISNAPDTESIRTKVREGVISGLSIGGRARRIKTFDPTLQKDVNRVITTRISEISLVDLPANKSSYFEVLKAACVGDNCPLNDGTEPIEKTDPVVEEAVKKFEEIITQNNTFQKEAIEMKDNLTKLELQIQVANDPEIDIVKGEENENNDYISTMNKNVEVDGITGGITMEQTEDGIVRMEVDELTKYIRDTVDDMVVERETVEKLEDYDRLVREISDMRKKIEGLEAQAIKNAKALKTTPAMKSENTEDAEVVEKAAKKKKEPEVEYDEDGNEIIEENDMKIKKMEAEIATLKSSPLYKATQEDVPVEKTEASPASGVLAGVISAHYGGN